MLARLDLATADLHRPCERQWRRFLDEHGTLADYMSVLARTYGLEAPFEAACSYTRGFADIVDPRGRWRSGLIAQDLLALGWGAAGITSIRCAPITPFQDVTHALAWLYAVERPAALYPLVREKLEYRHADVQRATHYLAAFERIASRRHAELGTALDQLATSEIEVERVLAAATEAFEFVRDWYESPQVELLVG